MTANYEGHYTVEVICAIQDQHKAFYFLYVVRATGSGTTHTRKKFSFSFFIRNVSNLGVCQNSTITDLLWTVSAQCINNASDSQSKDHQHCCALLYHLTSLLATILALISKATPVYKREIKIIVFIALKVKNPYATLQLTFSPMLGPNSPKLPKSCEVPRKAFTAQLHPVPPRASDVRSLPARYFHTPATPGHLRHTCVVSGIAT